MNLTPKIKGEYVFIQLNPKWIVGEFTYKDNFKIKELQGKRCWEIVNEKGMKCYFLDDNRILFRRDSEYKFLTFSFRKDKKFNVFDPSKKDYIKLEIENLIYEFAIPFNYDFSLEL